MGIGPEGFFASDPETIKSRKPAEASRLSRSEVEKGLGFRVYRGQRPWQLIRCGFAARPKRLSPCVTQHSERNLRAMVAHVIGGIRSIDHSIRSDIE